LRAPPLPGTPAFAAESARALNRESPDRLHVAYSLSSAYYSLSK
jgi:hypothetical protein